MKHWIVISLLLCSYGLFKEIRPSEPFLTEYLEGKWVNLTEDQVNYEVYPVWTYSYLGFLVIVFLITDFLRYKPVIIVESIAYIITWILLLWGKGVIAMQMMELLYGVATSTEVAYYTYIYAVVELDVYQKVTGFARSALLLGQFFSGILSQALVSSGAMDYRSLNFISLSSVSVAFVLAILLPAAPGSIYFHRKEIAITNKEDRNTITEANTITIKFSPYQKFKDAVFAIVQDLKNGYSKPSVMKWSLWWAFATCGNLQVGNYIQPLWETVTPSLINNTLINNTDASTSLYNGAVEATHTFLSSASAFGLGYIHIEWTVFGEIVIGLFSLLEAAVLILMAQTTSIMVAYASYIIFRTSYQMLITIVSYQVAKNLPKDSHGLIFGCNTFFALLFQTILTVVVADKSGLHLKPKSQFIVYGFYFGVLSLVFIIMGVHTFYLFKKKKYNVLSE